VPGFHGRLLLGIAAAGLACGGVSFATRAGAQTGPALPSASLAESLNAWSRATGVEILADPALLRGKRAPAVRRAATAEAALAQLLRGSGLTYQKRGRTYLIVRNSRGSQQIGANPARPRATSRPLAPERPGPGAAIPASAASEPEATSDIIVTGTRIARPELESAMPVVVLRMDEAKNQGRDTAYDALLLNPAIGPGLGESNSQGQEYDTGVANINLRNMGNNRSTGSAGSLAARGPRRSISTPFPPR
jgi:iron complex outermembrane recepter protein